MFITLIHIFQLHLIAANEPYTGNMGGVSGADGTCYRQAKLAGLRGTYKAFLGSKVQHLSSIVHRHEDLYLPIVNTKVGTTCVWCVREIVLIEYAFVKRFLIIGVYCVFV